MKLWNLSIQKPVTVFMGLVCIIVLGAISYQRLKLAFLPKVDFPFMMVQVIYPNQNPEILEREITRPLEEALATLKGVKKIQSNTSADSVNVQLQFNWGMELDLIRLDLGLKVEEIKPTLPDGVRDIYVLSFNSEDIPVLNGRIAAPGIDLSENYDLLEKHIKQKIERVSGVAKVELGGVLPKEVSIELKLDQINAHGVDVGKVIERLSQDNVMVSAGKLKTNGLVYNVRADGKIHDLDSFGQLVVDERGLVLADIADIVYEEPPIGLRRHLDGHKALALDVFKESTANTVEVTAAINQVIEQEIAKDPVLDGIELLVWNDQGEEVINGLNGLKQAGLYGALFAILTLFMFLRRIKATLIVATAIPISIMASFIILYALDYTLNVLTMMGLMLAVGMLVDNAVVVLESIWAKRQQGLSMVASTRDGTREVVGALIAATSTTVIVFFSLVVSDANELAVWLGAIGMTICITLVASLLVSTTVIPLFASHFLDRPPENKQGKGNLLVRGYGAILDVALRRPAITAILLVLAVLSSVIPAGQLSQFSGTNYKNNRLFIEYELHDFFFLSEAEDVVDQVEAFLESKREAYGLKSIYSYMEENRAETTVYFADEHISYDRYKEIRADIRDNLPDIAGVSFVFNDDDGDSSQSVSLQLFGTDHATLKRVGEDLAKRLEGIDGLYDVRAGQDSGKKELRVSVDREQANLYGINPETIAQVFGFTLGSTYLPRFNRDGRETDVTLGLRIEDRATIEDISNLRIGGGVKLGSVAKFEYHDRPQMIRRVDRKAHHRVRATFEGDNFDAMKAEIEARLANVQMPPGVVWSWSDRILQDQNEMSSMLLNIVLALVLVYLVMASLFESLVQPFIVFFTILFSLTGVFWMLFLTQTGFEVMAMIGVMILIGIVVNNGIILMDRFNYLIRGGMSVREAVQQSAHDRIRPILMTASTTIFGLIPMAVGNSGIGGGYYYPLARCVIGGLASSTLLTLVGLPIVILTWFGFKAGVVKIFKRTIHPPPLSDLIKPTA